VTEQAYSSYDRTASPRSGRTGGGLLRPGEDGVEIVLTDIVLPDGMGGLELAKRLLEGNPTLRIIFTSGYSADIAGRYLSLQVGQGFIQTPSSPRQLLETVRRALDS
jgi:two-component system, cell cycle sensor histidine kinase and response regulator CckA